MSPVDDAVARLDLQQSEVFEMVVSDRIGCSDGLVATFLTGATGVPVSDVHVAAYRKDRL